MEQQRTMGTTGTWSPGQSSPSTGEAASSHLRAAAQSAREGIEHAGELINETVTKTQDAVSRYREGGVDRMKEDVVGYTRQQPMTALLVASAVGVFLGMLMAMGRSR